MIANQLQRAIDMLGGFRMKSNDVCAGFGEIGDDAIDWLDHQMHIDRHLHMRPDRLAYQRPNSQIRNVMIIHHIEMNNVSAGGYNITHFLAKTRKNNQKKTKNKTKERQDKQ